METALACEIRSQVDFVSALSPFALMIHVDIVRQVYDFNELAADDLTGASGGDIVRIAGYPELSHSVFSGKRQEKTARPGGVAISSVLGLDFICDVSAVHPDIIRLANSKRYGADFRGATRAAEFEQVRRDESLARIGRRSLEERQLQFIVDQPIRGFPGEIACI